MRIDSTAGYDVHSEQNRAQMLQAIGGDSIDAPFAHIPDAIHMSRALDLPKGLFRGGVPGGHR